MDIGAILVGAAAAILLAAYIARPFRGGTPQASAADLDAMIEGWVSEARKPSSRPAAPAARAEATRFCHHCGQPVKPDHRFCPHCGTRLDED